MDFNFEYSLVIGKFLKQKTEGKPLTIYGDGNQTREFCYIDDVVEANISAMNSKKIKGGEVINIGSGKSYSINYLAKLIGGKVKYLPPRSGDVLHTKADITLAKKLLNWSPKVSLEEGLEKTKQWFEKIYLKK
jgi:nucleoside-diphosphate-sugar epimerase